MLVCLWLEMELAVYGREVTHAHIGNSYQIVIYEISVDHNCYAIPNQDLEYAFIVEPDKTRWVSNW